MRSVPPKDPQLASRVRLAIDHSKRKQVDLAAALGITSAQLSDMATGKRPGRRHLARLAEETGVPALWLSEGRDPPQWAVHALELERKGAAMFTNAERVPLDVPGIGQVTALLKPLPLGWDCAGWELPPQAPESVKEAAISWDHWDAQRPAATSRDGLLAILREQIAAVAGAGMPPSDLHKQDLRIAGRAVTAYTSTVWGAGTASNPRGAPAARARILCNDDDQTEWADVVRPSAKDALDAAIELARDEIEHSQRTSE